jgi:hypothetical protein
MRLNPASKVGDKWDSVIMPTVDSITPITDGAGRVVAFVISISMLVKWNSVGRSLGELTALLKEAEELYP